MLVRIEVRAEAPKMLACEAPTWRGGGRRLILDIEEPVVADATQQLGSATSRSTRLSPLYPAQRLLNYPLGLVSLCSAGWAFNALVPGPAQMADFRRFLG